MTVKTPTGAELPDLFADNSERVQASGWTSYGSLTRARTVRHAFASGTVPMHVREGIAASGLSAGIITSGTATGEEGWAGELVAARGCVQMLDIGRIADDGVRRHVWPGWDDEPAQTLLKTSLFAAHGQTTPTGEHAASPFTQEDRRTFVRAVLEQLVEAVIGLAGRTSAARPYPYRDPVARDKALTFLAEALANLNDGYGIADLIDELAGRMPTSDATASQSAPADPEARAVASEPPRDPQADLQRLARAMLDVPAAVAVERPTVPELTDRPLENARRLFALTVSQLADLFGVTERQMHRYLRDGVPEIRRPLADALVAVGLTVIGGLGADGARRWLYSGEPTGAELAQRGDIAQLAARADALRDSPAT